MGGSRRGDGGWPAVSGDDGIYIQSLEDPGAKLCVHVRPVSQDIQHKPRLPLVTPRQDSRLDFGEEASSDALNHSCRRQGKLSVQGRTQGVPVVRRILLDLWWWGCLLWALARRHPLHRLRQAREGFLQFKRGGAASTVAIWRSGVRRFVLRRLVNLI